MHTKYAPVQRRIL